MIFPEKAQSVWTILLLFRWVDGDKQSKFKTSSLVMKLRGMVNILIMLPTLIQHKAQDSNYDLQDMILKLLV